MRYLVRNAAGDILRQGECPAELLHLQAGPGEVVKEVEEFVCDIRHKVIDDRIVEVPVPPKEFTHAQLRCDDYLPVGDQLDTLWRWVASLPDALLNDEVRAVLLHIDSVKQQYPKTKE